MEEQKRKEKRRAEKKDEKERRRENKIGKERRRQEKKRKGKNNKIQFPHQASLYWILPPSQRH